MSRSVSLFLCPFLSPHFSLSPSLSSPLSKPPTGSGAPHERSVRTMWIENKRTAQVSWGTGAVLLSDVQRVELGKKTDVLKSTDDSVPDQFCFSLISADRTLDLQCKNLVERDFWARNLRRIITKFQQTPDGSAAAAATGAAATATAAENTNVVEDEATARAGLDAFLATVRFSLSLSLSVSVSRTHTLSFFSLFFFTSS
jgi:hypothetical protein